MIIDEDLRDRALLNEISRITHDYGALHRHTVRDLAASRAELAKAHMVLGTVAHDLRTPLSTVLGFMELLLEDPELTPSQRELGERVDSAARTMTSLTDDLVDAVTTGVSPLRCTHVDVALLVGRVITRHQLLHPPRGVRVVLEQDASEGFPTFVLGDETKLERVLDNLISNAIKFSPAHGVVHVRVAAVDDGEDVEIRVRDDGPGVPADQLIDIFFPFHRTVAAAAVPGIGLGLTIVKQITERHGGQVYVESVPGAGATFVVRLPMSIEAR